MEKERLVLLLCLSLGKVRRLSLCLGAMSGLMSYFCLLEVNCFFLLLKEMRAEMVIALPWLLNFFGSAICAKALLFPNENVKVGLSVSGTLQK